MSVTVFFGARVVATLRCSCQLGSQGLLAQVVKWRICRFPLDLGSCVLDELDRELDGNPPAVFVQRPNGK